MTDLLSGHSVPSSRSLIKTLNSTATYINTCGTPLVMNCQLDFVPVVYPLNLMVQSLLHPPHCHSTSISNLAIRILWETLLVVKVKTYNIHCSVPVHKTSHLIQATGLARQNLPLTNTAGCTQSPSRTFLCVEIQ